MSIHERLPPQARRELKEVGWTKGWGWQRSRAGTVSTSIAQPGCTKRESCRRRISGGQWEKELTGKEEEPSELIYFKVYKSQIPVIEQAIETAALMLGTDNRAVTVWR